MQRPFIHPCAYSILNLLSSAIFTAAFILLLSLFCYCYYYKTVATDPLLRASLFTGAAELTTQLLRLISILCLPLCRTNKFGLYYPRRLLRSPILVGYQDYFLAPLPGSIALLISSPGEYTLPLSLLLFYFVLFAFLYQKHKKISVVFSLLLSSFFLLSLFLSSITLLSLLLSSLFLSCFIFS